MAQEALLQGVIFKSFSTVRERAALQDYEATERDFIHHVHYGRGPTAIPLEVTFVEERPKTRSGKITRRLLKAQTLGQDPGDTLTLN